MGNRPPAATAAEGRWRRRLGLMLATALVAPPVAALRVTPIDWTPGAGSAQPSLATTGEGGVVLNWQQKDGQAARLRVARFDAGASAPRASAEVARGTGWFVNWADFPSLAVLDNGDWATFTLRKSAGSTYAYDIHLQRSTDGGATWSAPVVVGGSGLPVQHGFAALLPDGGDRVLLVWLDGREGVDPKQAGHDAHHDHEEGRMTLRSAVVGRDGVPRARARIDADTCSCCQTDLVRRGGEVLAVYRDHVEGIRDIAMVRRGADGRWQAPRPVHADGWRMPGCPVNGPAAAVNGQTLAVAWPTMARGPLEVKLAISPREGAAFATPTVLDAGAGALGRVDVVPWRGGGFLASWVGSEAGSAVLRVAEVDARGRVGERREVVRLPPGRQLGHPRMAVTGERVMLAWTEPESDGPRVRLAWIQ